VAAARAASATLDKRLACAHEENWFLRRRLTAASGAAHAAAARVGALSAACGTRRQHKSTQRVPDHGQEWAAGGSDFGPAASFRTVRRGIPLSNKHDRVPALDAVPGTTGLLARLPNVAVDRAIVTANQISVLGPHRTLWAAFIAPAQRA